MFQKSNTISSNSNSLKDNPIKKIYYESFFTGVHAEYFVVLRQAQQSDVPLEVGCLRNN